MQIVHSISNIIFKFEKGLAILLLLIMFVSLSLGVIFRYFLNSPLLWSGEIAIFSLVWLTFVGGSMTIKTETSAAVSIFVDNLPEKFKKIILTISFFIMLIFAAYFFYISLQWISSPSIFVQRSSSMQMPMIIPYLSVVVSFFTITIHSLSLFIGNLLGK